MEPRTGPFLTTVSLSQLSDVGQYDESLSLSPPPALPLVPDDQKNNLQKETMRIHYITYCIVYARCTPLYCNAYGICGSDAATSMLHLLHSCATFKHSKIQGLKLLFLLQYLLEFCGLV